MGVLIKLGTDIYIQLQALIRDLSTRVQFPPPQK